MKRNSVKKGLALLLAMIFCSSCGAAETETTAETEMAALESKEDTLQPIYGTELEDGAYFIDVDSSSSMFRVVSAVLHVKQGEMTADLTLSGQGYLRLFMGTGEEALKAEESAFYYYTEDAEGAYTYTVPVEALDMEIDCAAWSIRKEKWYDRVLVFEADTLRPWAADGEYSADVTLEGGSGKSTVLSPTKLYLKKGTMTAMLEWSSPYYDYMIVEDEKYLPINTEGNSVFEIPVERLGEPMTVIADTVAMSTPHEIEYTLTFECAELR